MKKLSLIAAIATISLSLQASMLSAVVVSEQDSYEMLSRQAQSVSSSAGPFKLFVWNVFKTGKKDEFFKQWNQFQESESPDLVAFQEAVIIDSNNKKLCLLKSDCDFGLAFEYPSHHRDIEAGVMTSSKFPIEQGATLHSDSLEPFLHTPKSSLINRIDIEGSEVLLVNTHGINFVTLNAYDIQLKEIAKYIQSYKGPLIWAGDFNTWNGGRIQILERYVKKLGLQEVSFANDKVIKRLMGNKLDHIFTRGLKVSNAHALKTTGSDHSPLVVELALENY